MPVTNYPNPRGYADRIATKAPDWHDLVVFDVLFNNLTTGLFLVAAFCDLVLPTVFSGVATWAYPLALFLLLIDLALLVLDLGDPLRFHHMLRVFKPSSPMSLGTWCLTAYSLFLTAAIAISFVEIYLAQDAAIRWARVAVVGCGIPFAFGSAAYKGVLFSTTAQPGWRDARWLGAYLVNSAVVLGLAQLMLIASIASSEKAVEMLALPIQLLIVLNYIVFALLARESSTILREVCTKESYALALLAHFLIGTLLPIAVLAVSRGIVAVIVGLIALLLSHLAVRWAMVRLPHWLLEKGR